MDIYVKVKTNAKRNLVTKNDENHWLVETTAAPIDNKANKKIIELISKDLGLAKSRISIKSGLNVKNKIIDIV